MTRANVAQALADHQDKAMLAPLVKALGDEYTGVRAMAAATLEKIEDGKS